MTRHQCPDEGRLHTPVPDGYIDRANDAARRLSRHQRQEQCPTCGLWVVWRAATAVTR